MNDSLLRVVSEVHDGTDTVSTASSQIAAGNLDLSLRTDEYASALAGTAAMMEEITSTVEQNGENLRVATQLASSASSVASRDGEIVQEVAKIPGGS